jgi:ribonuclease HII
MRIGADEAGKGPALGPMVAAAVRADPQALPENLDDSKRLTPNSREQLDADLRDDPSVAVAVAVISPERIDAPDTDMNSLGVAAQAEAVAGLAEPADHLIADAADTDAGRFGSRLSDTINAEGGPKLDVTAEHGADESHPIVSAASVVAKVERDRRMTSIGAEYDGDVGSGYPGDPTTRTFLENYVDEHGELPACARESWATCEDVLAAATQSALGEF